MEEKKDKSLRSVRTYQGDLSGASKKTNKKSKIKEAISKEEDLKKEKETTSKIEKIKKDDISLKTKERSLREKLKEKNLSDNDISNVVVEKEGLKKERQEIEKQKTLVESGVLKTYTVQKEKKSTDIKRIFRKAVIIISAIALFVGGGAILTGIYIKNKNEIVPEIPKTQRTIADVLYELGKENVDVTNGFTGLQETLSVPKKVNQLVGILPYINASSGPVQISAKTFLRQTTTAPDILTASISDFFYIGSYSSGTSRSFVLLFELSSYTSAFAGILDWENGNLVDDLSSLFSIQFKTTPSEIQEGGSPLFSDLVINNVDVRKASFEDGRSVLYGFPNTKFLIIAGSEEAFSAVLKRALLIK